MANTRDLRTLAGLRNIGPSTAARFAAADIGSTDKLRPTGAATAYRRLKHAHPCETTLGALTDTPWNALSAEVREQLRHEAET